MEDEEYIAGDERDGRMEVEIRDQRQGMMRMKDDDGDENGLTAMQARRPGKQT